jgi:amino acid transporter
MRRIVITYGLIAGAIVCAMMYLTMPIGKEKNDFEMGEILGYVSMIVALSMVFFGVKIFRDKHLEGKITFGKGFVTGLYITLIAAVMYCVGWEIYYNTAASDFMANYTTNYIEKMQEEGASQQEIDEMTAEMASMSEMYKNPVIRFGMTFMEIFPVGLLISLISAGILRRKDFLPATE